MKEKVDIAFVARVTNLTKHDLIPGPGMIVHGELDEGVIGISPNYTEAMRGGEEARNAWLDSFGWLVGADTGPPMGAELYQSYHIGATGLMMFLQFSIRDGLQNIVSVGIFSRSDDLGYAGALDRSKGPICRRDTTQSTFKRDGLKVGATIGSSKKPLIKVEFSEITETVPSCSGARSKRTATSSSAGAASSAYDCSTDSDIYFDAEENLIANEDGMDDDDEAYEEAIEAIEFFMDDDDDNYVDAAENLGANEDGMDDDDDGRMARWLVSQFQ